MPRPQRRRRVCEEPEFNSFFPEGIPCKDEVVLSIDEYEVIRLIDLEQLTHAQAAQRMDISRPTATEIYNSARIKFADCIVNGKNFSFREETTNCAQAEAAEMYAERKTRKNQFILRKETIL